MTNKEELMRATPTDRDREADPRDGVWMPVETIPKHLTRVLMVWPAYELDDNMDLTDKRCGETIGVGYRDGTSMWSGPPEREANGAAFDDDWEYGDPIAWMPLPDFKALPAPPPSQE